MGTITSNIGLITGLPITDTVDKLMQIASRSRDLIVSRTQQIQGEGAAIAQLTAATLAVQFAAKKLSNADLFTAKSATSSNPSALGATVTGNPTVGNYQFTPVRLAQTQHSLSSGVGSVDGDLTPGTLSLRFGGYVDTGISLAELNGGQGVPKGQIRITDRSGATAQIDLRNAQTVDDVLEAINSNGTLAVTAIADGDHFKIIDNSGGSAANLRVQEVGNGTTAAALGLAGVNVAASSASGLDVVRLYDNLLLDRLNNGNGVSFSKTSPDLVVNFRDGSAALNIDFLNPTPAPGKTEKTLGDLLATINAADPARLRAQISLDGDHLQLIDLTTDNGGTFSVASTSGGKVAQELGLTGTASGDTITSGQLQAGIKTALLSSLGGGSGLGQLGTLNLTDRSGATAAVDLSAARTLDDVINSINGAGLGIQARVNEARNGLLLTDTTSATASNLIIENGDATNTADKLGLAVNAAVTSKNGGTLNLQVVSAQTRLADLNGGRGVSAGSIIITDSAGTSDAIKTGIAGIETVGDVINAINSLAANVTARLNDAGDGILLIDNAGGGGTLTVTDLGSGKAAKDLHLLDTAQTVLVDGVSRQVIDGSTTLKVTIASGDSLQDLVDKINALDAGVTAGVFNDGSSVAPFRLSLLSQISGKAGALRIDGSRAGFSFQDLAKPQDALLSFGGDNGSGFLTSSSTNTFTNLVDGLSVTVAGTSTSPVSVSVAATNNSLVSALNSFVTQYNNLRDKLSSLTSIDDQAQTTGPLFGSLEALRIDTQLGNLLSSRFFGVGSIQSLQEIGLSLDDKGKLSLDTVKLNAKFSAQPDDVKKLFTDENLGVAKKLDSQLEQLVGAGNSLLVGRAAALQRKIDENNERIAVQNARLDTQRARLLKSFNDLESAIAKIKSNQSAISLIQPISIFNTSSSTNSN